MNLVVWMLGFFVGLEFVKNGVIVLRFFMCVRIRELGFLFLENVV